MKKKIFCKACEAYLHGLKICPDDESALRSLREAEYRFQAEGKALSSDYIADRLDQTNQMRLMGLGGTRSRQSGVAFQNILFDFNSDRIKPESYRQLNAIGGALSSELKNATAQFRIEGHTDDIGTDDYNRGLSLRRADSVMNYLIKTCGVEANRLSVQGFGEGQPVAANDNPEGRARNRRVEITLED